MNHLWVMTTHKITGKLARWSLLQHEYDFVVVHRAGIDNTDADCFSGYSLQSSGGAPVLEWSKGEVLALATYLAMMMGLPILVQAWEEKKEIWDDVEVLRFLQTL